MDDAREDFIDSIIQAAEERGYLVERNNKDLREIFLGKKKVDEVYLSEIYSQVINYLEANVKSLITETVGGQN